MPCFYPQPAMRSAEGVRFVTRGHLYNLMLPCGQCVGCRLERSRQWAVRCMHERQLHASNCFITLTYSDDCVPLDFSLDYYHFQCFLKRARKRLGSFRFFMCGEYGDRFYRPHYHACLFGVDFSDRVVAGSNFFTSKVLSELWPFGFSSVGDVTFESAAYVARYCMKKVTGPGAEDHYRRVDARTGECYDVTPEFTHMSLKPAIGLDWIRLYHPEVLVHDRVVVRGRLAQMPRYYRRYLAETREYQSHEVERELLRQQSVADQSIARLSVREAVCRARVSRFSRRVE